MYLVIICNLTHKRGIQRYRKINVKNIMKKFMWDPKQDPDPKPTESRIRIRIQTRKNSFRIHNTKLHKILCYSS
jgi:hypothetical protein